MNVLIIYDSVYGNTEKIAKAIAGTIPKSNKVKVLRVDEVSSSELKFVDLLIIGSPTHGGRPTPTIQKLIAKIPVNTLKNVNVATFDTRVDIFFAKLLGYAAGRIANSLKDKGGHLVVAPEGFIVNGKEGPLKKGELERAAGWAQGISRDIK